MISFIIYAEKDEEDRLRETLGSLDTEGSSGRAETIVIRDAEGEGQAFNKGLSLAKGDIILTLSSGDVYTRTALSRIMEEAEKGASDLVISGILKEMNFGKTEIRKPQSELCSETDLFINAVFTDIYDKGLLSACGNKLYRKKILEDHGLSYREDMSESAELEFCLRYMAASSAISLIGTPLIRKALRNDTADPEACMAVIASYNALFNGLDIDDDVINDMNGRIAGLCIDSLKKFYRSTGAGEMEKLCMLTGISRHKEFRELLKETGPWSAENGVLRFMLLHNKEGLLHKALLRLRQRDDIEVRRYRKAPEILHEDPKVQPVITEAQPEDTEPEKLSEEESAVQEENISKEEALPQESELSDSELDEIKDHLESGLMDL